MRCTLARILTGAIVGVVLALTAWGAVYRIRGGAELPPPKWTEADLAPLPPDSDNGWELIGPLSGMPDFTPRVALWDVAIPIPTGARAWVDAELERPEVRALLAKVPAVLERGYLFPPDTMNDPDVDTTRMHQWHRWMVFWLNRTLETDPESAAAILSKLYPLWVRSANVAGDDITFAMCVSAAKTDLDLMVRVVESAFAVGDTGPVERLRSILKDTPPISLQDLRVASYVRGYRELDAITSDTDGLPIDFRETFDRFNAYFEPDPVESLCATHDDEQGHPFLAYNGLGRRAAKAAAGLHCAFEPNRREAVRAVSEKQQKLSATLSGKLP